MKCQGTGNDPNDLEPNCKTCGSTGHLKDAKDRFVARTYTGDDIADHPFSSGKRIPVAFLCDGLDQTNGCVFG